MVRRGQLIALVVTFLVGCAVLLVAGASGVQAETSKKEEARCEGTRTIKESGSGEIVTTNDIPGCPKGGLLLGTEGSDRTLSRKPARPSLYGGDGDDVIRGLGGSDSISHGYGDDVIYGGDGNDGVFPDSGNDVIYGGDGNDKLDSGDDGGDKLYCGAGRDKYIADKNDYVDSSCETNSGAGPHQTGYTGHDVVVTTEEKTTATKGARSASKTKQEPAGLDVEVVSPVGQANLPAGFGEGSLWATDFQTGASQGGGLREPPEPLLRRLDPQTGEVVATIPLKGLNVPFTHVAFGAGSVWVSSSNDVMGAAPKRHPDDVVFRIDPRTNRVVDRIPVDPPSGLAFGHGSVWTTSASYGTLSRIDPQTGEVVAKIEVGRGAGDIAADESSGAMWIASSYLPKDPQGYDTPQNSQARNLTRVDPETNRVVAEIPIAADSLYGGASTVAVGEGAVWTHGDVKLRDGKLFKVDPATNEVSATASLGIYATHLVVYGGAVWAMIQEVREVRLVRVDPRTMEVVASEDIGPIDRLGPDGLAAGGGYVWFSSLDGLARVRVASASASPTPVPLGGTGGPAILLPAAALLLGSGILTYVILRRR